MRLSLLFSFVLLALNVNADFSDSVYNDLVYLANYAKVAYCAVESYFVAGEMEDSCPTVEFCEQSTDTDIVTVIHPDLAELEISGDAYVAADHSTNKVYAVFRGSFSPGDFITDVLFGYCPFAPILQNENINATLFDDVTASTPTEEVSSRISENSDTIPCEDCYVHCGVYVALSQFIQEVHDAAKPYLDEGYQLVITGHSLGGGYAALAGIEFLLAGYDPLVVTYASLRVGNPSFNVFVDEKFSTAANAEVVSNGGDLPVPSYSRVYQQTDVVPRLPPGPGYTHSGLQFEITKLLLPHLKENVDYLGASNNYENDAFEFDLSNPLALLILYQHLHEFIRISWPCDDSTWLLRAKREEQYQYINLVKRSFV